MVPAHATRRGATWKVGFPTRQARIAEVFLELHPIRVVQSGHAHPKRKLALGLGVLGIPQRARLYKTKGFLRSRFEGKEWNDRVVRVERCNSSWDSEAIFPRRRNTGAPSLARRPSSPTIPALDEPPEEKAEESLAPERLARIRIGVGRFLDGLSPGDLRAQRGKNLLEPGDVDRYLAFFSAPPCLREESLYVQMASRSKITLVIPAFRRIVNPRTSTPSVKP